MEKKGMRLVAMIESKDEKYEVINFLPDIKVEHTDGKNFKIEEKDYIKIPYAEGIDDLTVIVGENGVGKTRLVNDILSQSEKKLFIYRLGKDKLKFGEIIFPKLNQTDYKDEYNTQYRAKYIKLRDDILNNSFIREKFQKSSSDDWFKQILKYRIDAIGEQLIKRKLLSMWDNIRFSENLSDSSLEKSGMNGLFQKLKEASGNNKQILTIVSEIEELINSHNGEE
ncbi:hypothetical protein [Streptococcus sp. SS-4456]|uniref:hypothetical protein n=1 Tax=Streptococcus sp. SS-4456 TaxID=3072286 RepID=UPI002FC5D54E